MKNNSEIILESLKPQMKYFEVVGIPRVYINPRLGRIDLRISFSDVKALECYKDINFPYLKLKKGAETLFKKEKVAVILQLIEKATFLLDVEILAKAKPSNKKVQEKAMHRKEILN